MKRKDSETCDTLENLYKLIDPKQSEVRYGFLIAGIFQIIFLIFDFYLYFLDMQDDIVNLLLYLISGVVSLLGIAIAGVAIVIALFNTEQVRQLDKLKQGSFSRLLYDFKWFGLIAAIEVAIFIMLIFFIKLPLPLVHPIAFHGVGFFVTYAVFYLLFYACALIGNCIKLSQLKQSLDEILSMSKTESESATELKVDFLISKIFENDSEATKKFYGELIDVLQKNEFSNKANVLAYLKARHKA